MYLRISRYPKERSGMCENAYRELVRWEFWGGNQLVVDASKKKQGSPYRYVLNLIKTRLKYQSNNDLLMNWKIINVDSMAVNH